MPINKNKKSAKNVPVSKAPSERARRVKKICLLHIFSQSGEQAMLATRAEGWILRSKRLRESAEEKVQRKLCVLPTNAGSFHR